MNATKNNIIHDLEEENTEIQTTLEGTREELKRIKREYLTGAISLSSLAISELTEEFEVLINSLQI